ncbi:PGF-CTERM sorting domain-containing protein [Methanofollis aquaemaris]|uniref:PGF-CTERM sorting domain-containing protein n=1 Tax=Methanofollis aquaemaris TaxID=126734 RepID=A0A8A3S5U1_9EURY|nr:PGF-CTERM sorting domain-containing protein [Methanofollis aquaemaris]QSZ67627.1 PGF-CTERM sorting domain-containing protein [Methanofollis aquaemaris]
MNRMEILGILWITAIFWMVAPVGAYLEATADTHALAAGDVLTVTGQTDREGGVWIWAVEGGRLMCDHLETNEEGGFSWTVESATDSGGYTLFVQDAGEDGQPAVTFQEDDGRGEVVAPEGAGFSVRHGPGLAGRLADVFETGKGDDGIVRLTVPVYPSWADVDGPRVWEHGETITVSGTTNLAPGTVLTYELTEGGIETGADPAKIVAEGEITVEEGYGGRTWSFVLDTGHLNPGDHLFTLIDEKRNLILTTVERTVQGQEYDPTYLALAGDRLVWINPAIDPDHLYLVSMEDGTTTQVNAGTILDPYSAPALSTDHLVWVGKEENYSSSGHTKIFAYTIATGEKTGLTEWKRGPGMPAVDGNRVVWKERDDRTLNYSLTVAGYDLATGTGEVYPSEEGWKPYQPRTSGGLVVWGEYDGKGNARVIAYDTRTGKTEQFTTEIGWLEWPTVSEGYVVWAERPGDEYVVMMRTPGSDRSEEVARTPELRGFQANGGRFIWQETGDRKTYHLRILDAGERQVRTLLSKEGAFISPAISGDRVTWIERGRDRNEIMVYDLVTGEETTLPAPEFLNLTTPTVKETESLHTPMSEDTVPQSAETTPQAPGFGVAAALVALISAAGTGRR